MTVFVTRIDPGAGDDVGVAFTSRQDGVSRPPYGPLNLGRPGVDDPVDVARNFELVRTGLGVDRIVACHQVHGTTVAVVDDALLAALAPATLATPVVAGAPDGRGTVPDVAGAPAVPVADALVTTLAGVALCIRVADCVPVLVTDGVVIGAAHAGRVGLAAGVLQATVATMRSLGATGRLTCWIGPHICGACYEVPQEMADEVGAIVPGTRVRTSTGTPGLDLGAGAQGVLEGLGCRVVRVDPCTMTDDRLHSHRRDRQDAGRLGAFIWRRG